MTTDARTDLLERFGLFGTRYAVNLIRDGAVRHATGLAQSLIDLSGVIELRKVLASRIGSRRDVLKARSGLLALKVALVTHEFAHDNALALELERITAGAHEFAEMHLLDACRNGSVEFPSDELTEVERLVGASGTSITERLALPPDASVTDVHDALQEAMLKWQRRAESPLTSRDVADAARVLVRTCEGLSVAAMIADIA